MQRNKRLESLEQKYFPPPPRKLKLPRPDDPRYERCANFRGTLVTWEELELFGAMRKVCEGLDAATTELIERATNHALNSPPPPRKLK